MTVHYNYITLKDLVLINELSAIKFICIQLHASGTCADLEKKIQGGGGVQGITMFAGVGAETVFGDFSM